MKRIIFILCTLFLLAPAVTAITWSGGPGTITDNDFHLYLNGSTYSNIAWNVSVTTEPTLHYPIYPGEKYVFGDTLE